MPLIFSTSIKDGGLGLSPYQIGLTMGIWGFMNAFVQINLLGKMIRKYGGNQVYQITYACYFISVLTYPVSAYLARRNGAVGLGTCASVMIQLFFQFFSSMSYGMLVVFSGKSPSDGVFVKPGAIQVSIAESAPKPLLGSVNGLFQLAGSLMCTFTPTFASSLFSISLQTQILDGNLVYVVCCFIILVGIGFSRALTDPRGKTASHWSHFRT
jgi:hypothetical protein